MPEGAAVTVTYPAPPKAMPAVQKGETTLEFSEALNLTEAQVFHGLSYFFDHRDEISALIAQEEQAMPDSAKNEALYHRLYLDRHI